MRFLLAAATALSLAGAAQATVLFQDDFEGEAPRLAETSALAQWAVTGNIDVVQSGTFGITCPGRCIDLDGTRGPGAIVTGPIAYAAGAPVTVRFDLSGSQRSSANDGFGFEIIWDNGLESAGASYFLPVLGAGTEPAFSGGSTGLAYGVLIPGTAPFASYFFTFNPLAAGSFVIGFRSPSADNIGPLVDNVLVTQGVIPEPSTWAMLIAGLGLVGFAARRRSAVAA